MADNRIYIRCKACGEQLFLGKRLGGGYYWLDYGKLNNVMFSEDPKWVKSPEIPLHVRLNRFYKAHEWCGGTLDHFEISYDIPDADYALPTQWVLVSGLWTCPNCGHAPSDVYIPVEGWRYCPNCGTIIREAEDDD